MSDNMKPPFRNPIPELRATDAPIREAAQALASALTEGGGEYEVSVHSIDVTAYGDDGKRWAYEVRVIEHRDREIAP